MREDLAPSAVNRRTEEMVGEHPLLAAFLSLRVLLIAAAVAFVLGALVWLLFPSIALVVFFLALGATWVVLARRERGRKQEPRASSPDTPAA